MKANACENLENVGVMLHTQLVHTAVVQNHPRPRNADAKIADIHSTQQRDIDLKLVITANKHVRGAASGRRRTVAAAG